jgi:hypothetical protein
MIQGPESGRSRLCIVPPRKLVLELPGVRAAMSRIKAAEVALSIALSVSASTIGGLADSTATEITRDRALLNDLGSTSDYTNPHPPFSIPSLPVVLPDDDTSIAHREPLHELAMSTGYDGLLQPPPLPLCKRARSFCLMALYSFPDMR